MNMKIIPKEQLTAYQRWELGGLEEGAAEASADQIGEARHDDQDDGAAIGVSLPTAEDLERIHQEAWQEGYKLGAEEGRRDGFEAGKQDGRAHAERLKSLAEALDTERLRQDETLSKELLELALDLAHQVVRTSLKVKPEIILGVVREAMAVLPNLSGHTRLVVHPDSAPFAQEWLTHEHPHLHWKVVEDPNMEAGGFRVENTHSDLDATMPTRWREIVACLGTELSWLD